MSREVLQQDWYGLWRSFVFEVRCVWWHGRFHAQMLQLTPDRLLLICDRCKREIELVG